MPTAEPDEFHRCLDLLRSIDLTHIDGVGRAHALRASSCLIIMHIHVLPSAVLLMVRLIQMGYDPSKIFVIPKPYSLVAEAADAIRNLNIAVFDAPLPAPFHTGQYDAAAAELLKHGCESAVAAADPASYSRVILVDDGGMLTQWWGRRERDIGRRAEVVSVQQTASGFFGPRLPFANCPKIDVARSAAKKHFESPIIAEGVLRAITQSRLLPQNAKIGVIGVGALGTKILHRLSTVAAERGYELFAYSHEYRSDPPANVTIAPNGAQLLNNADYIIGCTGRSCIVPAWLDGLNGKTFISCSSRDVEFKSLLEVRRAEIRYPSKAFETILVPSSNATPHRVMNGGFPINFNRTSEMESMAEISITRGMILTAIVQATLLRLTADLRRGGVLKLNSYAQRNLVLQWLRVNGRSMSDFGLGDEAMRLGWWETHSGGAEP